MLSKIIKSSLVRTFSTLINPSQINTKLQNIQNFQKLQPQQVVQILKSVGIQIKDVPITGTFPAQIIKQIQKMDIPNLEDQIISDQFRRVFQTEVKHFNHHVNSVKNEIKEQIILNFETEKDNKTLIFESSSEVNNNSKLGEIILLGSGYGLWNLLLGFPSYLSLAAVLGTGAVGGILSYSNYLRRTSSRITNIYKTKEGLLQIHYLKPSGLFSRSQHNFEIQQGKLSYISFGSPLLNMIRKLNNTKWIKIDGKLFWYNNQSVRVNNHHLQSLS